MILRLFSTSVRRSFIQIHTLRLLRTSVLALASEHDSGPQPVYVPKPASGERSWLGDYKVPSEKFPSDPYKPHKSDLYSFFGAGVGIVLTVLALTFYTDLFGKNIVKKGQGSKSQRHSDEGSQSPESHPPENERIEKVETALLSSKHTELEAEPSERKSETATSSLVTESEASNPPTEHQGKKLDDKYQEDSLRKQLELNKAEHEEISFEGDKYSDSHTKESPSLKDKRSSHIESLEEKTVKSSTGKEVPKCVEYLLIGAGAAAYYASLAIRARHAEAKVLMIGEENHLPYNRPPLSKELWWFGDGNVAETLEYEGITGRKRDIYFEAEGFFVPPAELPSNVHGGVSLLRGHRVNKLCPDEKKAYLDDGTCLSYNKCLIATGGKPKTLPELESASEDVKRNILYLRGVDDYRRLDFLCKRSTSILIVGGGFLGSELAYSIRRKYQDLKISQVVAENGNLSGVLPEFLSKRATESLREIGVDVITNSKITAARKHGEQLEVELNNGTKTINSDYVIVCIGIEPDTSVAEASGLEIDKRFGGVCTDAELRVRSDIWAAGDVASFYDRSLGRRRIEHWENAQVSGRLAGENMTGGAKVFWYQPAFFTKIAPQWYINAVGIIDSSLPTVSVFAKDDNANESYERGVVFYKGDDGKVVGVLLLNVFGSGIDVSRRLIEEGRKIDDFQELAKLYQLYKFTEPEEEKKESEENK